ncbi:hypothetical protein [Micromonospora chersina]|uniref:hypothetical protein n=1 Tax=Micromonospora chersina TaxID=47854 RepID=UPI00371DF987
MSRLVVQRIRLRWTVHVAHAPAHADLFRDARWSRDRDERVHLYGGPRPGRR